MSSMFFVYPPSLRYFRLGGFGILAIFLVDYFGGVSNFAYQTCNN